MDETEHTHRQLLRDAVRCKIKIRREIGYSDRSSNSDKLFKMLRVLDSDKPAEHIRVLPGV